MPTSAPPPKLPFSSLPVSFSAIQSTETDAEKDWMKYSSVMHKCGALHCQRGPRSCKKCQEAASHVKYRVKEFGCDDGKTCRPIIFVTFPDGSSLNTVYNTVDTFDNEADARKYIETHPDCFWDAN